MRAGRALLALLLLPGIVAGLVPWLLHPAGVDCNRWGAPVLLLGLVLLLWCVRDFLVTGHGTLAPWDPPVHLVRVGLYRYSRNPMYVAVALMLCGWAIGYRSGPLAIYGGLVVLAFHLRVSLVEEPTLARAFGDEWAAYCARVRRWL